MHPSSISSEMSSDSGAGSGFPVPPMKKLTSLSAMTAPTGVVNNCSVEQAGSSGLGPIMEIREISSYCNACVTPDKYWNHQQGACAVVPGTSSGRHSVVYPPMFYTPSPPQSYASCNVPPGPTASVTTAPPPPEWSCPPPPPPPPPQPSHTDSYSFLYSQFPPHSDYSNFLTIPTSCYETDFMMMGNIPGQPTGLTFQNENHYSENNSNNLLSSSSLAINQKHENSVKSTNPSSSPCSSDAMSSTSNDLLGDVEDNDDDDRQIISIEDDENAMDEHFLPVLSPCILCKKPATTVCSLSAAQQNSPQRPAPPSPQLSKILGDIDDNELDISVCSGDIEIGGIEDEMIQQGSYLEQGSSPFKITLERLSQLLRIPKHRLLPEETVKEQQPISGIHYAILCTKCQKVVDLAESLEKQLNSVLASLRHLSDNLDERLAGYTDNVKVSSVSIQTDKTDNAYNEARVDYRCIFVHRGSDESQSTLSGHSDSLNININSSESAINKSDNTVKLDLSATVTLSDSQFLCHICGASFSCGRNLGKHLKRIHIHQNQASLLPCTRGSCTQRFSNISKLNSHLQSHTSDKHHFCSVCFKLFSTKSNLNAHLKLESCTQKLVPTEKLEEINKPPKTKVIFTCEKCGLTFRTEKRFITHKLKICSNKGDGLFRCKQCLKAFAKNSELKVHEIIHSGTKPFTCNICGQSFTTKGNQIVHQRTHSQEKRFKCNQCGKGFTRNQALQFHTLMSH